MINRILRNPSKNNYIKNFNLYQLKVYLKYFINSIESLYRFLL